MSKTKERRKFIRTDQPIPVKLYLQEKGQDKIHELQTITKNLSVTGLLVQLSRDIASGTSFELKLILPKTANPVHINARVVRSEKSESNNMFNLGIEFLKIEEDNKNTFLKFLCDTIYKIA